MRLHRDKLFPLLLFILCIKEGDLDNECPQFCKCYMWNGLRRADCINQRLVNIETDIDTRVQVLDLSNNYIASLDNRGFQDLGLINVKYLNFHRNKISSVGLYAFEGLKNLQLLDLSDNYLQYLHPKTFEGNLALRALNLGQNKLGRSLSGPFLDAPFLKELDISRCQFGDINAAFFSELAELRKVNLSNNQLIRLNVNAMSPLVNLRELDLSLNPWPCSSETEELLHWLQEESIRDTTRCGDNKKLAKIVAYDEPETDAMEEYVWSDIEEVDRKVVVETTTTDEGIPSGWAMIIGFEVGVVLSVFAMYIWLQWPSTMKRRSHVSWTELETPICPDTPPPPYRSSTSHIHII